MNPLFTHFTVTLQIRRRICGGIPKSPEAIDGWIRATVEDKNRLEQLIADTQIAMGTPTLDAEQLEALKQSCWIGFKSNGAGLYIEGRQVKACLKESANIIKNLLDMTALKQRISERVYVVEENISLGVTEPTGSYEGMIHAMTASGPIHALKRVDYVERPQLSFTLKVLDEPYVTKSKGKISPLECLSLIFEHAGENGLGADRSQGNGQFDVLNFGVVPYAG